VCILSILSKNLCALAVQSLNIVPPGEDISETFSLSLFPFILIQFSLRLCALA